jgi:hypothetical protein
MRAGCGGPLLHDTRVYGLNGPPTADWYACRAGQPLQFELGEPARFAKVRAQQAARWQKLAGGDAAACW